MEPDRVEELLAKQAGVISRQQLLACGGDDDDIERAVRRREWARLHRGVFVDHTGPPTWEQRAWGAALLHWPAAVAGRSALVLLGLAEAGDGPIEVVVDRTRRVDDPPGVRTRQVRDLAGVAQLALSPPRVRVEHAVLAVASRARRDDTAVATLADAVQQRRTTPQRLRWTLLGLRRVPRRALLLEVLADVGEGAWSALERRYLRDVERAHGLPRARRQERGEAGGRTAYRDVLHDDTRTVVELDGRLGHETRADRWDDLDRDVDAVLGGLLTLRVGWRQVLEPCRLAGAVARVLQARGWTGTPRGCSPDCGVVQLDGRGSSAPDAGDPRPSVA